MVLGSAGLNVERRESRKAAIKTFLMSALSFVDADGKTQHVCGWRWETEALWSNTNAI